MASMRDYFLDKKSGYKIVIPSKIGVYPVLTGFKDIERCKKI
jgi:hypothetical protein